MTYKQHLDALTADARRDQSGFIVSQMLATSLLMQWEGGSAQADPQAVTDMATKLMKQKSFKEMMNDPLSARLANEGKHLELIQLMDIKENERRAEVEKYTRHDVKKDAAFLKDAVDALKNGSAKGRPAELEKKNPLYIEMIKQVEAAEQKAQSGIALTPAENRAMITSIRKYIDGGTKVAGGVKTAPHAKEAMCVLKEFMPEQEFNRYCDRMNFSHPRRKVDPNAFIYERMVSKVKTAEEIRREAKGALAVGFSEEACATIVAARNLSKGNSSALITPEMLETEKAKLLEKGSAFSLAMRNEKDRSLFKELAAAGRASDLGREIVRSSKNHTIGAAQWQVNRAIRTLTNGPVNRFFAEKNLATIFVAHELASRVAPDTKIDAKVFDDAREQIQNDPVFKKFCERYHTDRDFKNRINKDLELDKSGSIVALEMHKIRNPQAERRQQPQQDQVREPRQAEPEQPQRINQNERQPIPVA